MSWRISRRIKELISQERRLREKKHTDGQVSVVLVYPNTYYVGMSNLGYQKIYGLLNEHEGVHCDRCFLPDPPELELYHQQRPLVSLESQRPLKDFDLLAFSLSFELDYLNLLKIMELAQIPLLSSQRGPSHPLIIAGGICAMTNPEPLADYIDLFLIGEGEVLLPRLMDYLLTHEDWRRDRETHLQRLATLPGVYYPAGYAARFEEGNRFCGLQPQAGMPRQIRRQWLERLDQSPTHSQIITAFTEFSDTFLLEIGRGCSRRCNFCLSSSLYKPLRFYSLDTLLDQMREGLRFTKKIGLISPDLTSFPDLSLLCQEILKAGGQIAAPSLRIDRLTPNLLSLLASGGQKTITLAPEAATERLRKVINKDMTDEEILEGVDESLKAGILHLKLYFLIGLPSETAEDIHALIRLAKQIRHIAHRCFRSRKFTGNITISLTTFVPKPFTPFEREGMDTLESLKAKIGTIKRQLNRLDNLVVTHDLPKWAFIQCLLARGDRLIGRLLYAAHQNRGNWPQVFKEFNINPHYYTYRPFEKDEPLPWDILGGGGGTLKAT